MIWKWQYADALLYIVKRKFDATRGDDVVRTTENGKGSVRADVNDIVCLNRSRAELRSINTEAAIGVGGDMNAWQKSIGIALKRTIETTQSYM